MENLICLILCAKISVTKYEPPKVEQQAKPTNPLRVDDAKRDKRAKRISVVQQTNQPQGNVEQTIINHFGDQAPEAIEIVRRESTFNPKAINKSSGACGLFQSLPCKKMNCSLEDVECQVKWGKKYISQRYGTAANALAFHNRMNWY